MSTSQLVIRASRRSLGGGMLPLGLATMSLVAGVIHFHTTPEHFHEHWVFGLFFAALGTAQILWSALVLGRPSRWVHTLAVVGNLSVIGLWAASRWVGMPDGHGHWHRHGIAAPDLLASVAEALIVVGCAALLVSARGRGEVTLPTGSPRA